MSTIIVTVTSLCQDLFVQSSIGTTLRQDGLIMTAGVKAAMRNYQCQAAYFQFSGTDRVTPEMVAGLMEAEDWRPASRPWSPANTNELLAFARRFPREQMQGFEIIALNAHSSKGRCMRLWTQGPERAMTDGGIGNWDSSEARFLAIR